MNMMSEVVWLLWSLQGVQAKKCFEKTDNAFFLNISAANLPFLVFLEGFYWKDHSKPFLKSLVDIASVVHELSQ